MDLSPARDEKAHPDTIRVGFRREARIERDYARSLQIAVR
jgi:hypothetical protein